MFFIVISLYHTITTALTFTILLRLFITHKTERTGRCTWLTSDRYIALKNTLTRTYFTFPY